MSALHVFIIAFGSREASSRSNTENILDLPENKPVFSDAVDKGEKDRISPRLPNNGMRRSN